MLEQRVFSEAERRAKRKTKLKTEDKAGPCVTLTSQTRLSGLLLQLHHVQTIALATTRASHVAGADVAARCAPPW